jgi:hypothetical protein
MNNRKCLSDISRLHTDSWKEAYKAREPELVIKNIKLDALHIIENDEEDSLQLDLFAYHVRIHTIVERLLEEYPCDKEIKDRAESWIPSLVDTLIDETYAN